MKAILVGLFVLALGASGVFAAGPLGDDASTERTIPLSTSTGSSTTSSTSSTTTTETGEDVPGPCDEPEHANDPRCAGGTTTTRSTTTLPGTTTTTEREAGEDVRGPCDEAEHANDPRCAGGAEDADDDRRGSNSGPGGSDDSGHGSGGDDDSDDSRSGSNSGPG
jgi:hypothetical protein